MARSRSVGIQLRGLEDQIAELETMRRESQSNVERAVELSTNAVHRKARKSMREPKTGRVYVIKGRRHQASAPRTEAPARLTRRFYRSIFKRIIGTSGQVGSDEEEASWLEFGAMRAGGNLLERRPWLGPAVRSERKTWFRRLRRALNKSARTARAQVRARRAAEIEGRRR